MPPSKTTKQIMMRRHDLGPECKELFDFIALNRSEYTEKVQKKILEWTKLGIETDKDHTVINLPKDYDYGDARWR